jgi:hypothetical protein
MTLGRWATVLLVLVAACGGGESDTTTSAALTAPATDAISSTTEAVTTTTAAPGSAEPVVLVQSNPTVRQPIQPGRVYTYDLNLVPVAFRFVEAGWDIVAVGNRSIWISHAHEPLAAFVSFRGGQTPDELVAEIRVLASEASLALEQTEATIGGVEGVVLELPPGPPEADGPLPWLDSNWACGGYPLVEERILDARVTTIINPCSVNRLWVVGFDDVSVFVNVLDHSGTKEASTTLAEVEPLIEEFLAAINFRS